MTASSAQTAKTIALLPAISAIRQPVLRRKCDCGQHTSGGQCEECKKKKAEEKSSGDPLLQRSALNRSVVNGVPRVVNAAMQRRGSAIDAGIRSRLESSFHCDLSQVRVHSDEPAAHAAAAINARAFTFGQNIWFGRNEFAPHSSKGFHLLAHEVAHTIQQGSETAAVQTSLAVGAVDDPAEAAAERAADAAARFASVAQLANSRPVIRRAPAGPFPKVEDRGPDEKRVSLDEHTHYRIKRTKQPIRHTDRVPAPPRVGLCSDFGRAWVRVEWCRDRVRGHADVGVDVRNELRSMVPQLLQAVATRGDVASVFKNATVTPFLDVLVVQSGKWQLNLRVEADVGQRGATEERGNLVLRTEWFDLSAGVTVTQTPAGSTPTGNVILTIPLEKGAEVFKCKDKEKEWWEEVYQYECTQEKEPSPPSKPPAALSARDREIYFCWATTDFNEGKCSKAGPLDKGKESADNSAKAAAANAQALTALRGDFSDRYKVTAVTGYTSPEGPPGPRGKFEGNIALADDRGKEALNIVASRACFPRKPEICGLTGITPANGGSLPGSAGEYPLLRKATIHLEPPPPSSEPSQPKKPGLNLPEDYLQCPPGVIELAFGKERSKKLPDKDKDKDKDKNPPVECQ
jgi:hypothetical protein